MRKYILLSFLFAFVTAFAQSPFPDGVRIAKGVQLYPSGTYGNKLGFGTLTPAAAYDFISTTGGLAIPRMTTTQRNATAGQPVSTVIWNITNTRFEYFDGAVWQPLVNGGFTSLQQMYDDAPENLDVTASGNTATIRPFGFTTDDGSGSSTGIYTDQIIKTNGTATTIIEGGIVNVGTASGYLGQGDYEDNNFDGIQPTFVANGVDGEANYRPYGFSFRDPLLLGKYILKGEISNKQYYSYPDRPENTISTPYIFGTSVKVNGTSYPFNANGETDDIVVSSGGAVDSVNGQTGVVVLDAADVGADPAGTAAALLAGTITNGDTTHAPNGDAVFDALALKADVSTFSENAQDAVGGIVDATLVYSDATPSLGRAAISGDITIAAGSNTAAITAGAIVNADINASAGIAATKIANTPAGGISATNVQAAIDELDTEKASTTALAAKKSMAMMFQHTPINFADSQTYYFGGSYGFAPTTTSQRYVYAGITGTVTDVSVAFYPSTVGSGELVTVSIKNVTTGVTVSLGTMQMSALSNGLTATISLAVTKGDAVEIIVATPAWATNPITTYGVAQALITN